jgi:hypothetical protein
VDVDTDTRLEGVQVDQAHGEEVLDLLLHPSPRVLPFDLNVGVSNAVEVGPFGDGPIEIEAAATDVGSESVVRLSTLVVGPKKRARACNCWPRRHM